jgi:hypothetical protein
MTLVRPSPVEFQIQRMQSLDPERPKFYEWVVLTTRNIFMMLGFNGENPDFPNKIEELNKIIRDTIEVPFEAPFVCIVAAFDNPRFYGTKKAYCVIGEGIDAVEITKFQMQMRLDHIKQWCYDEIMQITPYVRFTQRAPF